MPRTRADCAASLRDPSLQKCSDYTQRRADWYDPGPAELPAIAQAIGVSTVIGSDACPIGSARCCVSRECEAGDAFECANERWHECAA